MAGHWATSAAHHVVHAETRPLLVETDRVERSAVPDNHVPVLLVRRIEDRLHEVHEPVRAADVLWRTAPGPVHESRIFPVRVAVANLLDDHVVPPVVAVVVGVDDPLHAACDQDAQPQALRLVDRRLVIELPERRIAVAAAVDVEFPEVREGPPHGHLDRIVQGLQCRRQGHVDAPPDLRLQLLQLDAQPRDPLAHRPVPSVFQLPDTA